MKSGRRSCGFTTATARAVARRPGTGRGTNIAVALDQFKWISGEDLIHRYDLPEARSFSTAVCTRCNCPVPKPTAAREHMIVPSGSLDDPPPIGPSAHANGRAA
jgi:hypothetical protein